MTNSNCLEGMQCPNCDSEGPFWMTAKARFFVSDNGTEEFNGIAWSGTDICECVACRYDGTVRDFQYPRPYSEEDADRLLQLGDKFLDQWADRAVQNGERDADYEERKAEWDGIRPLFRAAPSMLTVLKTLVSKADDVIAAIDGTAGQFDLQVAALSAACTAAESAINTAQKS
jgi:hypothetical protein